MNTGYIYKMYLVIRHSAFMINPKLFRFKKILDKKFNASIDRIDLKILEENSIRNRCKIFTYMPVFTTLSG